MEKRGRPTNCRSYSPVALKNGVLIVYVDNSVWLNEINSFWKQEILLKLQSAFGEKMIKNIYFTIG
ncbi:MAG: DciA family protein [Verrucomicrobiia bacterium]